MDNKEPVWLSEIRTSAGKSFESLSMPKSQYTKMKVDFDYVRSNTKSTTRGIASLPKSLESLINDRSNIVIAQSNDAIGYVNVPEEFVKQGVIVTDMKTAIEKHESAVKDFFGKRAIKPENKFTAFNYANFSSGVFIHVPKNVRLGTVHYIVALAGDISVINQVLINVEEGSEMTFVEHCHSERAHAFVSSITELHAAANSKVSYISFQNFSSEVDVVSDRRAVLQRDARLNWMIGRLGGSLSRDVRDTDLVGEGASVSDVEMFFGSGSQHFDITSNINHKVPNTNGNVLVKGVLKDKARSVSQGMIRIDKDAQKTDSFLAEHTLILSRDARSDAVPGLEIEANDVKATHSASVSQIDGDQIFYLGCRGLSDEESKKLIVLGFLESAFEKIHAEAQQSFRQLIEAKWGDAQC